MSKSIKFWGVWCKDVGKSGAWLRENSFNLENPLLAYTSIRAAQRRAAEYAGFDTYTEAKRKDWCEVRPL